MGLLGLGSLAAFVGLVGLGPGRRGGRRRSELARQRHGLGGRLGLSRGGQLSFSRHLAGTQPAFHGPRSASAVLPPRPGCSARTAPRPEWPGGGLGGRGRVGRCGFGARLLGWLGLRPVRLGRHSGLFVQVGGRGSSVCVGSSAGLESSWATSGPADKSGAGRSGRVDVSAVGGSGVRAGAGGAGEADWPGAGATEDAGEEARGGAALATGRARARRAWRRRRAGPGRDRGWDRGGWAGRARAAGRAPEEGRSPGAGRAGGACQGRQGRRLRRRRPGPGRRRGEAGVRPGGAWRGDPTAGRRRDPGPRGCRATPRWEVPRSTAGGPGRGADYPGPARGGRRHGSHGRRRSGRPSRAGRRDDPERARPDGGAAPRRPGRTEPLGRTRPMRRVRSRRAKLGAEGSRGRSGGTAQDLAGDRPAGARRTAGRVVPGGTLKRLAPAGEALRIGPGGQRRGRSWPARARTGMAAPLPARAPAAVLAAVVPAA